MNTATKWQRFKYYPVLPLGDEGRIVTGSKEHITLLETSIMPGEKKSI